MQVILVSNGHGEDAIGTLLASALKRHHTDLTITAYPTVDDGKVYERAGLPVLGPRRLMPSSGLLFHNLGLFVRDMRAGFIPMSVRQYQELGQLKADIVIVIGDAYGLLLGSRIKTNNLFYLQSLVSAYHREAKVRPQLNRYFMERVSLPERFMMRRAKRVYVRDEATAVMLREQGVEHVSALGNPMLDALHGQVMVQYKTHPLVALLPGTRAYATKALETMMNAFTYLPFGTGLVAWAGAELPEAAGWLAFNPDKAEADVGLEKIYRQSDKIIYVYKNRFADVLCTAQLVMGTAGTANEQAAALGKPVLSFPVPPLYSKTFLTNQQRLLADALTVVPSGEKIIADTLWELYTDRARYQQAARVGRLRMGRAGGSDAIARDILARSSL